MGALTNLAAVRPAPKAAVPSAALAPARGLGAVPETAREAREPERERESAPLPRLIRGLLASAGEPLDPATGGFARARLGHDFGRVRIHAGSDAAAAAALLESNAFTVGDHIAFAAGRYAPATPGGRWLLTHELAHTLQQRGGSMLQRLPGDAAAAAYPGERTADAAADAVADAALAGRAVPAISSGPQTIQRQRVASVERESDDVRVATLDDGTRTRVRRIRWLAPRTETTSRDIGAQPGIDRQRVWLDVQWCAGENSGTVQIGANIPDQVVQTIIRTITSGGDLRGALGQVQLTPSLDTTFLRSGSFSLSGHGEVHLDIHGNVTGGGGSVGVSTGPLDVTIGASSEQTGGRQDVRVTGGITFTPGRQTERHECRRERTVIDEHTRYECEQIRPPQQPRPLNPPAAAPETHSRYIYFEYATDAVAAASVGPIADITNDLRNGFRVTSIRGFTSPEGPQAAGRGFIGNRALAQKRAEKAAAVVAGSCVTAAVPGAQCNAAGPGSVTPTGEGELYTLTALDASGASHEVEGEPLARHATEEFLTQAAEQQHRTPALQARLTAPGATPEQQADLVYPLLRRAEVRLVRATPPSPFSVRGSIESIRDLPSGATACSNDIVEAVFPPAEQAVRGAAR